jgi:hypothetical protein
VSWTWAKEADEAMCLLESFAFEEVSLDHDLGTELDGADVLEFIRDNAVNDNWGAGHGRTPLIIGIHTANPVERIAMINTARMIPGVKLVTAESKTGQRF